MSHLASLRLQAFVILFCVTCCSVSIADADKSIDEPDAETLKFVATKVLPILEARCYECHGPKVSEPKANLRVDSRASMLAGGDSGSAIDLDAPAQSMLIEAIGWAGDYEMPPDTRCPAVKSTF